MREYLKLWRQDPEIRHFVRLLVIQPYLLWTVVQVEEVDRIFAHVNEPTKLALAFKCLLLTLPIVVHGLYVVVQHRREIRNLRASYMRENHRLVVRSGDMVLHPEHGEWCVLWARAGQMVITRERSTRMVSGSELSEWVVVIVEAGQK